MWNNAELEVHKTVLLEKENLILDVFLLTLYFWKPFYPFCGTTVFFSCTYHKFISSVALLDQTLTLGVPRTNISYFTCSWPEYNCAIQNFIDKFWTIVTV